MREYSQEGRGESRDQKRESTVESDLEETVSLQRRKGGSPPSLYLLSGPELSPVHNEWAVGVCLAKLTERSTERRVALAFLKGHRLADVDLGELRESAKDASG